MTPHESNKAAYECVAAASKAARTVMQQDECTVDDVAKLAEAAINFARAAVTLAALRDTHNPVACA